MIAGHLERIDTRLTSIEFYLEALLRDTGSIEKPVRWIESHLRRRTVRP